MKQNPYCRPTTVQELLADATHFLLPNFQQGALPLPLFCFISKVLLRVRACCFASTPLPTGTGTTEFCGLTIAGGLGFGGTDEDRDFQGACGGAGLGLEHERSSASKLALNCAGLNGRATVPGFGLETGGGNFPRDAALGCFAGGPDSSIEGMTSNVLRF